MNYHKVHIQTRTGRINRRLHLALHLLLLVSLVAACSPASPGGETPPVTPAASETFTSSDGSLTFQMPSGWFMLNFPNDTAILATKQELLNNPGVIPAGECELVIGPIKPNTIEGLRQNPLYNQIVKNDPPTAGEMLDLLLAQMNVSSASDNQEKKLGNKQALLATFTQTLGDQKTNGSLMVLESSPGAYIFIQTVAAEGNLETCQAGANQVAESAQYQP